MPLANNLKKHVFSSVAIIATLGAVALLPGVARAQSMYAINEDIWRFDLSGTTATATKIKDFAASNWTAFSGGAAGYGNSLAYNNVNNSLIYGDASTLNFSTYNLSTGTVTSLGTLAVAGYDLTGYNFGGSASFYNGKYYVMPELTAAGNATTTKPWNFMIEVTLNTAGTAVASTKIVGGTTDSPNRDWGANVSNGFGDGGDIAIDKTSGKFYGFSSAVTNPTGTNSISGFYTANINSPTSGVTVLDATLTGGQAAFSNGGLYRNNGVASIQSRNLTSGAVINTYTLSGYSETVIADMAAAADTPEPGSVALMVSAGAAPLGGFLLRRRNARKAAARA